MQLKQDQAKESSVVDFDAARKINEKSCVSVRELKTLQTAESWQA